MGTTMKLEGNRKNFLFVGRNVYSILKSFTIVISFWVTSSDALNLAHYPRLRPSTSAIQCHSRAIFRLNACRSSDRDKPSKDNKKSERQRSDRKTYRINLELANLTKQNAGRPSVYQVKVALNLLRSMEAPDTVAYNSVLNVFAKLSPVPFEGSSRFSTALQAQQLLQEMEQLYAEQKLANQKWYDALTEGSLEDGQLSKGPPAVLVKPNSRSYCTVIDAYARIGNQAAAEKTEQLLHQLQQMYEATGDEALRPNLIAYNIVLAAWSKVGGPEAADRCLTWLKEGMPMAPDTISYNSVLHAIALSGEQQAGHRAEELLREMIEKSNHTMVNGRSYTTCMDAWSKTGRPDKAISLLREMKENYKRTSDASFQPNCVSYATAIHGYALSKDADKVQKAYRVFREMLDDGVNPNRITYINLLNCCATSDFNLEVIQLVKKLYREALDSNKVDHRTFGSVLKACMHHCWEDKEFAVAVFQDACKRGFVSQGVFWQFKQAVPSEIFRKVLGDIDVTHSDLPEEWTRNLGGNRMTTFEQQES